MVDVHRINCGSVNCYIVVDNDRAILIDTGRRKYQKKILEMCREFNVSLIVLTHGHLDHCQNVAYLAKILNIPVAMSEKDINMIPDNRKQSMLGNVVLLDWKNLYWN